MGLKTIVAFVLLAIIAKLAFNLFVVLDVGKHVYNHAPGQCTLVEGIEDGSEDIQVMKDGVALFTTGLRYGSARQTRAHVKSHIFTFDFNKPNQKPEKVTIQGEHFNYDTFNAHGISIWEDSQTGAVTVFVVNHPVGPGDHHSQVEKFRWEKNSHTLSHVDTIRDTSFRMLNDLVAVSSNSFYITNQLYYHHLLLATFEHLFLLPWGAVVFYNGKEGKVVADHLIWPNGIAISNDKTQIYVMEIGKRQIKTFKVQPDNSLEHKVDHEIGFAADNLDVDEEGNIWAAGQPVLWKLSQKMEADYSVVAPSQVIRLRFEGEKLVSFDDIYADDGHRLQMATIATHYRDAFLVGSVSHKLVYCKLEHFAV